MPDASLEILIKTLADNFGSKAVQDELDKLKGKAEEAGKGVNDAGEKGRESFEKFNIRGREARELMHKLNEIAPGLGMALKAALNPESIGILGLVFALGALIEHFKKANEEAQKFFENAAKPVGDMATAFREAVDNLASSRMAFKDFVEDIQRESGAIAKQLGVVSQAINDNAEAFKKLSKLKESGQPHPGISGEEKVGVEQLKQQQDATAKALAQAKDEEAKAIKRAQETDAAANDVKRREQLKDDPDKIRRYQEDQKIAQQAADAAQEAFDKKREQYTANGIIADPQEEAEARDKTKQELERLNRLIAALQEQMSHAKVSDDQAKRDNEAAKKAATEASQAVKTLTDKLDAQGKAVAAAQADIGLRAGGVGPIVAEGAAALVTRAHGERLSQGQIQSLRALSTLLEGIHANNTTMVSIIQGAAGNAQALAAQVKVIEQRQKELAAKLGVLAEP